MINSDAEKEADHEEPIKYEGYLKGLTDDQIEYVSQAADKRCGVVIKPAKKIGQNETEICTASILRKNFTHTENKLFIEFDDQNHLNIQSRYSRVLSQNHCVPVFADFRLKFWYFRTLTKCVSNISDEMIAKVTPDYQSLSDFELCDLDERDLKGKYSEDQLQALKVVISSPPSGPPCLITGAFGTGKTHLLATLADYYFQLSKHTKNSSRILVCTQQRESADNFFQLFEELMTLEGDAKVFIVRDYGFHIKRLKKWYKKTNEFEAIVQDAKDEDNYLVIMPCLTTPRIADFLQTSNFFTHIFIDEGAQMREPEAIAPLCLATKETKIVIAGDHWQVCVETDVMHTHKFCCL